MKMNTMKDMKIGQRVSFAYSGGRDSVRRTSIQDEARLVHGVVTKINRVTVVVTEYYDNGSMIFLRKPEELFIQRESRLKFGL